MNRRDALKLFGLAPVAGVMAARDASHEIFIGEHVGESVSPRAPVKVPLRDLEWLQSRRITARVVVGGAR